MESIPKLRRGGTYTQRVPQKSDFIPIWGGLAGTYTHLGWIRVFSFFFLVRVRVRVRFIKKAKPLP